MILTLTALLVLTASPDDAAVAAALATRSRAELARGELNPALDDIHQAFTLDPKPELLIQVADCEQALGHSAQARTALRRYLAEVPDAPDRAKVEHRVAQLALAPPETPSPAMNPPANEGAAAPPGAVAATAPKEPAEPPEKVHILPWALGALGVAGIVTAAVGAAQISSYNSTVQVINGGEAGNYNASTITPEERNARTWQPIAIVSIVVGALAFGGAVLTW